MAVVAVGASKAGTQEINTVQLNAITLLVGVRQGHEQESKMTHLLVISSEEGFRANSKTNTR